MTASADLAGAVSRLVERQIVDRRAIVDGDFRLSSAARRNRNLRIDRCRGTGYLVKEPEPGTTAARTLRTEAGFYALCEREPRLAAVARRMVRHRPVEPAAGEAPLLVVELLAGSRSLWRSFRERPAGGFPFPVAESLGRALATLHEVFRTCDLDAFPELADLGSEPPWVFRLHRPHLELLRRLGPARRQLLGIVQGEAEVGPALDAAAHAWRIETVIHGDVRSDNVRVIDDDTRDAPDLRLIDWELVQRGDPAWDLAGAFQDLVLYWLLSMPQAPDLDPEARAAGAHTPLEVVQAAIRAIRRGYDAGREPGGENGEALYDRAVSCAGARMLQTVWEYAAGCERLPSVAVLLLQIAVHVLRDAGAAKIGLFGLTASS